MKTALTYAAILLIVAVLGAIGLKVFVTVDEWLGTTGYVPLNDRH